MEPKKSYFEHRAAETLYDMSDNWKPEDSSTDPLVASALLWMAVRCDPELKGQYEGRMARARYYAVKASIEKADWHRHANDIKVADAIEEAAKNTYPDEYQIMHKNEVSKASITQQEEKAPVTQPKRHANIQTVLVRAMVLMAFWALLVIVGPALQFPSWLQGIDVGAMIGATVLAVAMAWKSD